MSLRSCGLQASLWLLDYSNPLNETTRRASLRAGFKREKSL
jgi:hypothetical protein